MTADSFRKLLALFQANRLQVQAILSHLEQYPDSGVKLYADTQSLLRDTESIMSDLDEAIAYKEKPQEVPF